MDKFRFPKSVDFHLPSALVGSLSKNRNIYSIIKADIDKHLRSPLDLKNLMKVVDDIDKTKGLGFIESMRILGNLMEYLRIKLLSKDFTTIEMTAILLDVLVKNCQYRIHIFVGRKNFMKTYCYVMRQLLGDHRHAHQRAGIRMVDILQGWGEAFTEHRKDVYPFLVSSYEKTRYKYGIKYPRPVYDSRRVPIFLDPVNQYELDEARETRAEWMIEAAKHEDDKWGKPEEASQADMQSLGSLSSDPLTNEEQSSSHDSDMMLFQDKEMVPEPMTSSRSRSDDMNGTSKATAVSAKREMIDFDEIAPVPAKPTPIQTPSTSEQNGSNPMTKKESTFMQNIDSMYGKNSNSSDSTSVTTSASTLSPASVSSNGSAEPMRYNLGSVSIPLSGSHSSSSDHNANNGGRMRGVVPTGSNDSFLELNSNVSKMFYTMKEEGGSHVPKPREKTPAAGKVPAPVTKVIEVLPPIPDVQLKPVEKVKETPVPVVVEKPILVKIPAIEKPIEKPKEIVQEPVKENIPVVEKEVQKVIEEKTTPSPPAEEDISNIALKTSKVVQPVTTNQSQEASLDCDDAVVEDTDNTKYSALDKLRQRKTGFTFIPPSVDSTVQVKFFGNQRIVIKK